MKHRIRTARSGDLSGLVRLQQIFAGDRLTPRTLARGLRSASRLTLVVDTAGRVSGSAIALLRRNSRAVRLYDLAVARGSRRSGIGTALLKAIERRARRNGAASIHLEVRSDNAGAQTFYRHNGYAPFGRYEHYYEDGADALRMRKPLTPAHTGGPPRVLV
jgi:[ribosomal protein S18]-alanine N-acetyltransferase